MVKHLKYIFTNLIHINPGGMCVFTDFYNLVAHLKMGGGLKIS